MSSSSWDYPIVNPEYNFSAGFHDVVFYLRDNANLDYMFDDIVIPDLDKPSYDSMAIGIQNYSETATTDVGMVSSSDPCFALFLNNYESNLKCKCFIGTGKMSNSPTGYVWFNGGMYLAFGSKIYTNAMPLIGCAAFMPANLSFLFGEGDLFYSGVYSALLEQIDNFNYISGYQSYEKGSDYITIYTDDYEATFNSDDTTGSITYYGSNEK